MVIGAVRIGLASFADGRWDDSDGRSEVRGVGRVG